MDITLSIVVPIYNEGNTILFVLDSLLKELKEEVFEIICVNDGSSDNTSELVGQYVKLHSQVTLMEHVKNMGKTAALRTGIAATSGKIVIIQDADMEYDPSEICEIIAPIKNNKADIVYGSRFMVRHASRLIYFRHYLANKFLTALCNLFTDLNFTDIETGYKAFRGEIIRNMIIESSGFGFEIEVTAKVSKLGCRIYEVPISYYGRTYKEGKKIGYKDGIAALYYILKYNIFFNIKTSFKTIPSPHWYI